MSHVTSERYHNKREKRKIFVSQNEGDEFFRNKCKGLLCKYGIQEVVFVRLY